MLTLFHIMSTSCFHHFVYPCDVILSPVLFGIYHCYCTNVLQVEEALSEVDFQLKLDLHFTDNEQQ